MLNSTLTVWEVKLGQWWTFAPAVYNQHSLTERAWLKHMVIHLWTFLIIIQESLQYGKSKQKDHNMKIKKKSFLRHLKWTTFPIFYV